jgi:hypothetical protein
MPGLTGKGGATADLKLYLIIYTNLDRHAF